MVVLLSSSIKMDPKKCSCSMQRKMRVSLKLAEELNELSTVILQQVNKPEKELEEKITWGIGDVYYRLNQITEFYDKEKIMTQAHSRRKDLNHLNHLNNE